MVVDVLLPFELVLSLPGPLLVSDELLPEICPELPWLPPCVVLLVLLVFEPGVLAMPGCGWPVVDVSVLVEEESETDGVLPGLVTCCSLSFAVVASSADVSVLAAFLLT